MRVRLSSAKASILCSAEKACVLAPWKYLLSRSALDQST